MKNFLSGVFRLEAQRGYFDGANPVKLAEVPAFAPNGAETKPYSLEEIGAMLKVLTDPRRQPLRLLLSRGSAWAN